MNRLFSLLLCVFTGSSLSAMTLTEMPTTVEKKPTPLAKWQFTDTETKLIFEDGREATLLLNVHEKLKISTKMIIQENLCFPEELAQNCHWDYLFGGYDISFVWTRHSDSTKLKQTLVVKSETSSTKLVFTFDDTDFYDINLPEIAKTKANPILTCGHDNWIKNLPKNEKQNYEIPAWALEVMNANVFTRKNENMSFFQANNVELKPIGQFQWELHPDPNGLGVDKSVPLVDPNTIYYQNGKNRCSIQIRIEKSLFSIIARAESAPIVASYSFPLGKMMSKQVRAQSMFYSIQNVTRVQSQTNPITVE